MRRVYRVLTNPISDYYIIYYATSATRRVGGVKVTIFKENFFGSLFFLLATTFSTSTTKTWEY